VKDLAQVLFSVPADAAEAVACLLAEEGAGVEQRDAETTPSIAKDVTELVVWLPSSTVEKRVRQVETLLKSLQELGTRAEPWSWSSEEVKPEAWEEAYKRFFKVTRLGRHFVVQPSWEEYDPQPRELVIKLDPGMAFGTGLHVSTQLVVSAMERLAHSGIAPRLVLDLGCGSGILAIAAAKLWPTSKVQAIDRDEVAVAVCRENVAHNGLGSRIIVERLEGAELDGVFELVLANLSSESLTELQPKMRERVSDFGYLILSGLTASQAQRIAVLYCRELQMEPEYSEAAEGWRALLLKARE
jgi:ribosomal protein L11 methyltransferase